MHDPGQPSVHVGVSAVAVARFNATPPEKRNPPGVGGYHKLTDSQTLVHSASDMNRVNGAAWANDDGLHICVCDYSETSLRAAAGEVKGWGQSWNIPMTHLATENWLGAGILGHVQVEEANHVPGGHTDPRDFPWDLFMGYVHGTPAPKGTPVFVGMASAPRGAGYWIVKDDGAVFYYGDKKYKYHGGANQYGKLASPITGITATPSGKGYWLLGGDGGVFSFGDAEYYGRPR